jgi:hypothetical protein
VPIPLSYTVYIIYPLTCETLNNIYVVFDTSNMHEAEKETSLLLMRAHYRWRASPKVDVSGISCVWKIWWYMNESMLALQLENDPFKP